MTQLLEARAGREGSTVGCGDFAASERRRIVQAKAAAIESLALAERCSWSELSCSCAGLSPKLQRATGAVSRAWTS